MGELKELYQNSILWTSILAWIIAQCLKVVLTVIFYRKIDITRFVGAGGMPSSHSALVVSLATSIGQIHGYDSPLFAIAIVFSLVVMYDAAGVRRAAGRQAAVLNDILDKIYAHEEIPPEKLKELLGHTPVEVIAGALLGFVVARLSL